MRITFLIGNGFDLGMGILSKFSDYFPEYCKASANKVGRIKRLSECIVADQDEWSYFEHQLGQYTQNFSPETKQDFIDQVNDFQEGFLDYIEQQEKSLLFDNTDAISEMIKRALTNYYSTDNLPVESSEKIKDLYSAHANESHQYQFISFNYTSILEKCIKTVQDRIIQKRQSPSSKVPNIFDKVEKIHHVHGTTKLYSIIGVNDASQVANEELAKDKSFLKFLVKPEINKRLRMNYDIIANTMILQSKIICVYGMSIGETDRKWWDTILTWLSKSSDRHLILFLYDSTFTSSTPFARLRKEDELLARLTQYSLHSINAASLSSRIHIAINKNIFQMNLVKDHNVI